MKLITEETITALLNYLMTRPYGEVANGVMMLQNLQNAPEPKEETNG